MKPHSTLLKWLFLCLTFSAQAQVKFKVKLLPDNVTYQVLFKPEATWSSPFNSVPSAQVTLVVPTGGFSVGTVTSHYGNWMHNTTIVAPSENPGYDYIIFGLASATSDIPFVEGQEVAVFEFTREGTCTGALTLINHDTDPFMPPNSQSANVGNALSVIGAGIGVNAYSGNYGDFPADCEPLENYCGIEVYDVIITPPSQCGVADGSIEIQAVNNGTGFPLQYSIDGGQSYSFDSIFTGLASGNYIEIIVRDFPPICIVNLGEFTMSGPVSAVVTDVELTDPSCGNLDGQIAVTAYSPVGGTLNYGVGSPPVYQDSNVINGLGAGTYDLWIFDITNNCESLIGSYTLNDCPAEPCVGTFRVENTGNSDYLVSMVPGVTYAASQDTTHQLQLTLKVPHSGFEVSNLTSQISGVNFAIDSYYQAPSEAPDWDYITFKLTTTNTTAIPYIAGQTVNLFSFSNTGTCAGDSVYIMSDTDPFYPPNSENADVGLVLSVSGAGGVANVCLDEGSVAACSEEPPPAPPSCLLTYILEQDTDGTYRVSLLSDTTWSFPLNITASMQVTIKVPTGGFSLNNLTSLISGVSFSVASIYAAPPEDPAHDYISIILNSPGTSAITYNEGQKKPLFSFRNNGDCTGGEVSLMDNDTDPFAPPNSQNANVGQQLTVAGYGAADAPLCISDGNITDCLPCSGGSITVSADVNICEGDTAWLSVSGVTGSIAWSPASSLSCADCAEPLATPDTTTVYTVTVTDSLGCTTSDQVTVTVTPAPQPDFNVSVACSQQTTLFNDLTTSIGTINSWNWDLGDGSSPSNEQNPAHIYSNSGNFEVSLTVTTEEGCSASFSEFVTVFQGLSEAPFDTYSICNGDSVQISAPANAVSILWSPSTGLSDPTAMQPMASPTTTTVYTYTGTTSDGCSGTGSVTVGVANKPVIVEVNVNPQTDCDNPNGWIEIVATGTGSLEYSIDNGTTWQPSNFFLNLAAGDYVLMVRNQGGLCPVAFNFNPVTVDPPASPSITSVNSVQPSSCGSNDGSININATGGIQPLLYSIDGGQTFQNSGIFTNLLPGTYTIVVANADATCTVQHSAPITLSEPTPPAIAGVNVVHPTSCIVENGSIQITGVSNNGSGLQYSIDGSNWFTSNTFNLLAPGTYTPWIAYVGGICPVQGTPVVLNEPADPAIQNPVDDFSLCEGQTASVAIQTTIGISSYTIGGGGLFINDAANGNQLGFDVLAGTAGSSSNFIVEITGINGCSVVDSFQLATLPSPTADFQITSQTCVNGRVTLLFSGTADPSATLSWSLDGGEVLYSSPVTATEPAGANVVVSWNTPGSKTIELVIEQFGCTDQATTTIDITNFDPGLAVETTDVTICNGQNGSINLSLTASGNYSFDWDGPGVTGATTQNLTNLGPGTYQVTITENNTQCTATATAVIDAPQPVSIASISSSPATDCSGSANNGSISIEIIGGDPPFQYQLFDAANPGVVLASFVNASTSVTFENLVAGAYQLVISSSTGCTISETTTVSGINSALAVDMVGSEAATCQNTADGALTVSLTGGQAPFSYDMFRNNTLINNDQTLGDSLLQLNDLLPGTYVLIFTDDLGCVVPAVVEVEFEEGDFGVQSAVTVPSCNNQDGSIILSGFPAGSEFTWEGTNGIPMDGDSALYNLGVGIYTVTITEPVNGCSSEYTFVLEPEGGPSVSIDALTAALCSDGSGTLTFSVSGDNPFSYEVLNAGFSGFGTPGEAILVEGLDVGAYVVKVTDLLTDCQAFDAFVIEGPTPLQLNTVVTGASGCDVHNASICMTFSGGTGPYLIDAPEGDFPTDPVFEGACITSLYEGMIPITITDANGCSITTSIVLPEQPVVALSADSVTILGYNCPGESGAIISNTANQYLIFDNNNNLVAMTPWTTAPAGDYLVRYISGNCVAELPVTVVGPPAWNVGTDVHAVGCDGNDGSIALSISGGHGNYSITWAHGATGEILTGLSAGYYFATITDGMGCTTTLDSIFIGMDCPCLPVFNVDTFYTVLQAGLTEVCLPTDVPDIEVYDLILDGSTYANDIGQCTDNAVFYGYGILENLGDPPFHMDQWTYNGNQVTDFTFNTIDELVNYMNQLDVFGNWINDAAQSSISGGLPGRSYGPLVITHIGTNTTLNLQVNTVSVAHPSIFVNNEPTHVFIVEDPDNGCRDTLFINVLDGGQPSTDTIHVTVPLNGTASICLQTNELPGTPELISNECPALMLNSQFVLTSDNCLDIKGLSLGEDQACMVICDDQEVCDTTIVIVEVIDTSKQLVIYNGFSPNEDGYNDFFKIKNIELYPDNSLIIYNRWGNMVFQTKSYTNARPWKAIYKNTYLPDGSYFYILEVTINGKQERFSGYVEVRR